MVIKDEQLTEILQLAIAMDCTNKDPAKAKRHSPRFTTDNLRARCEVLMFNQVVSAHQVNIVNISNRGVQFVWPGFLYNQTRIRFTTNIAGTEIPLQFEAETVWCKLLRGRYHCVGAKSLSKIPVHSLISDDVWNKACEEHPELLDPLEGRIAVLTSNDLIQRTINFQLQDTRFEQRRYSTTGSFFDTLERGNAELAIIDADSENIEPSSVIEYCRSRFFVGPIVILSLEQGHASVVNNDSLRRSRFVRLPMDPRSIVHAIRDIVSEHPKCMRNTKPIYSIAPATKHRESCLSEFIELAKESCEKGRFALELNDLESVIRVMRSMVACGASLGYPELSDVANEFIDAAVDPEQRHKLAALYRSTVSVIHRLHPGWPTNNDD